MSQPVLIETSLWIEGLRRDGRPDRKRRVDELIRNGSAAWCEMVLLELWNGARGSEEKQRLKFFEQEIIMLPTTAEVWNFSYAVARAARGKGLTIPNPDLLIFACARHHGVELEHADEHFEQLKKLKV